MRVDRDRGHQHRPGDEQEIDREDLGEQRARLHEQDGVLTPISAKAALADTPRAAPPQLLDSTGKGWRQQRLGLVWRGGPYSRERPAGFNRPGAARRQKPGAAYAFAALYSVKY